MNEQRMRFRVGVFVLSALVILAVLIIMFSSFPSILKSHVQYTIVFDDAPGVSAGTPVRRSGVRIGEVRGLALNDETGQVRVAVLVEKPHSLRKGDQPTLVRGLLGGDSSIDFIPKGPDRTPVATTEEMTGSLAPDASTFINKTTDLLPSTEGALNEIRKSMQRFEKMSPQLEDAIREYRELAKAAREALPELRRTNDEIQVTARNWGKLGERVDVLVQTNQEKLIKTLDIFNDTVSRISKVFNEENQRNLSATLKNVRAGSESLDSVAKNTDQLVKDGRETVKRANDVLANLQQGTKPLADRGASVMKNLDESTDRLNKTLVEARELLRSINQGNGTLRNLINDPALYNNLNDASCMVVRILPRLDRILRDLEVFSDKIARHPETLGAGGIINPSKGLK